MHADCSKECMAAAGIRPTAAWLMFEGPFGELWVLTDRDVIAIMKRVFGGSKNERQG